ncbi:L-lactate dehydrogenase [Methylosinus sp. C49]|uniref:L-lactate dehydrogenase n=1 Tax=Methylosinus sp. C49 TaxID=2699395 RepID=UPI0013679373|nr:L-lactate dehydrogenase [Methylosinus sp. C49]BBU61668.1 L-lactate dehydrogenase [Methylosinus sp. C49]
MIISSAADYREAARRRLPRFLFDYIDGGAGAERTLAANMADLQSVTLRQRVMQGVAGVDLSTQWLGVAADLPVLIAPIGMSGMFARRGEVQGARAAAKKGVPFILSTLSVCPLEEVAAASARPIWLQLYMLKDRGFMENMLARASAAGIEHLVFTVDLPALGVRYRDAHSGMAGPFAPQRRLMQALAKPAWAYDVGLMGRPHDLGNVAAYLGGAMKQKNYLRDIAANVDPTLDWSTLDWVRARWPGRIILKGVLDEADARDAVRCGVEAIIVSNHGGRQLDGARSVARMLPRIADAVGDDLLLLADSGARSGLDVLRLLALGARGVALGRAYAFALAAAGQGGVETMLDIFAAELRVGMMLCGVGEVKGVGRGILSS